MFQKSRPVLLSTEALSCEQRRQAKMIASCGRPINLLMALPPAIHERLQHRTSLIWALSEHATYDRYLVNVIEATHSDTLH